MNIEKYKEEREEVEELAKEIMKHMMLNNFTVRQAELVPELLTNEIKAKTAILNFGPIHAHMSTANERGTKKRPLSIEELPSHKF